MSVNVIKARLNSLRNNLPTRDVERSVVANFNAMVDELEVELGNPEVSHFKVPPTEVTTKVVQVVPGRGATYTTEKYCDRRTFKTQVEGLWEYLLDSGVIKSETVAPAPKPLHSGDIYVQGPVTASVIQQGSQNTATVNYQNEVQKVLEEIQPTLNGSRLTPEAKQELRAEFETVQAQVKSPKPKSTIIKESLISARHILEHAFGASLAQYYPLLVEFLKHR